MSWLDDVKEHGADTSGQLKQLVNGSMIDSKNTRKRV
ncbi:hypothetical protein [Acinetobacter phage Ab69]|nr:hypothetical protein [Acinetobacter phage Ab69]